RDGRRASAKTARGHPRSRCCRVQSSHGSDDEGTFAGLKACRELIALKSKQHRGRIVNTPGDSALVEFASAIDAARCAFEIQKEMAERNSVIPEDRRLEFRIGINVGEIIVDAGYIYVEVV